MSEKQGDEDMHEESDIQEEEYDETERETSGRQLIVEDVDQDRIERKKKKSLVAEHLSSV